MYYARQPSDIMLPMLPPEYLHEPVQASRLGKPPADWGTSWLLGWAKPAISELPVFGRSGHLPLGARSVSHPGRLEDHSESSAGCNAPAACREVLVCCKRWWAPTASKVRSPLGRDLTDRVC